MNILSPCRYVFGASKLTIKVGWEWVTETELNEKCANFTQVWKGYGAIQFRTTTGPNTLIREGFTFLKLI